MMLNKNKLKAKVIENGLTMEKVAKALDINVTTLYRKINGTSDFTRSEMHKIKDLLNLSDKEAIDIFLPQTCVNIKS